ncbi:hypothetical protein ACFLSQ_06620 [Bacteroidota bacterium]
MKRFGYLLFYFVIFNVSFSQQLRIEKYDGESVLIELSEIDSLMFQRNKLPQNISSPDTVKFVNINCERYYADTTFSITNPGDKVLLITHVELSPRSDFNFVEEPPTVMSIEPHQKYYFRIRFEPNVISEIKKAILTVTSNSQSGVYHKIYLNGKKDSLDFNLSDTEWNFGDVCYNSDIDTSISITNTGEGSISIFVSTSEAGSYPGQTIILNPGENEDVQFHINTGFEPGNKAIRVVCTDNCGKEKNLVVRYNVLKPNILIDTTRFIAKLGDSNVQTVKFHNNSNDYITIESIEINDHQFVLLTDDLPITIPAHAVYDFGIDYTPITENPVHAKIIFSGQPCDFEFTGKLIGDPNKKIYLLNEDFEKYTTGVFPDEGGWVICYGIDSLGYIVDSIAKNENKSLYIQGASEPDIRSYYIKHRLDNVPDKIFVEAWIMIDRGHAGSGIYVAGSDAMSYYAGVQYGNHGHYFSTLGSHNGTWEDKPEYYMAGIFMWNKLSFLFDRKNKTQKIYINDFLVLEDSCTACSFGEIESVVLYSSQTGSYLDDVKVWYYEDEE